MPVKYTTGTSNQNTSIGTDPLTANTYTYVNGDPINYNDPTGHMPCDQNACGSVKALVAQENQIQANEQQQQQANDWNTYVAYTTNQAKGNNGGNTPSSSDVVEQMAYDITAFVGCIPIAIQNAGGYLSVQKAEAHCASIPGAGYQGVYQYLQSGGAQAPLANTQLLGTALCAQQIGECQKFGLSDLIGLATSLPASIPGIGELDGGGATAADAIDSALGITADAASASVEDAANDAADQFLTCLGGESFSPDTEVRLANGQNEPIAQLHPGDEVLATDPATGLTTAKKVEAVWVNHDTDLLDLTIATPTGHTTIRTTQHHLFYDLTTHNWVEAENLHPGDQLYTADGQLATLVGTVIVPGAADMWDLTVANDHDFYIDTLTTAVLVHNISCDLDALSASGQDPIGNQGMTKAGASLEQHGLDLGFSEADLAGGAKNLNPLAQDLLDDILTDPGSTFSSPTSGNYAGGTRVISPTGAGATFNASGVFRYFGLYDF